MRAKRAFWLQPDKSPLIRPPGTFSPNAGRRDSNSTTPHSCLSMTQPIGFTQTTTTEFPAPAIRAAVPSVPGKIEKLLLVDFENVPQFTLAKVAKDVSIVIYVGVSQKAIPVELVEAAQPWGDRIQWQRVDASGPNALDFFIACKLGQVLESARHTHCLVLSKDKGFDPLIRHLNGQGLKCMRVERIGPAPTTVPKAPVVVSQPTKPTPPASPSPPIKPAAIAQPAAPTPAQPATHYDRVLTHLRKAPRTRPTTRKTLKNHVSSLTQKKLSDTELNKLIAKLQSEKRIAFSGEKVTYTL